MKKIYINIIMVMLVLSVTGCGKFTDLKPKGSNMLQKVTDLDLLLNYNFEGSNELPSVLIGDFIASSTSTVEQIINTPATGVKLHVNYTCDESKIPTLEKETQTNDIYTEYYGIIGKVCNPVILKADDADGDKELAKQIKAEAYVLRAFYHWRLVNLYAKAYDPATAATDGGIPYSRETDLLSVPNPKYTVKEVYDFIIEDLDNAISSNALSNPTNNRMRVNNAFAYAVKAKVLLCTRDYAGAYEAATASLAIENHVDDHNTMLLYESDKNREYNSDGSEKIGPDGNVVNSPGWSFSRPNAIGMISKEDLFLIKYVYLFSIISSADFNKDCDPGNIFVHHSNQTPLDMYSCVDGIRNFNDDDVYLNYGGLTTVDMYLTQAECKIRENKISEAMDIINFVRRHRIAVNGIYDRTTASAQNTLDIIAPENYYKPLAASAKSKAIAILKQIDREENWTNDKHFFNVKRWNTETEWQQTFTKTYNCTTAAKNAEGSTIYPITATYSFTLKPDSKLYIWPFPQKSINLNPNLSQNY